MPPVLFHHSTPVMLSSISARSFTASANITLGSVPNATGPGPNWSPEVIITLLTLLVTIPCGIRDAYDLIIHTRKNRKEKMSDRCPASPSCISCAEKSTQPNSNMTRTSTSTTLVEPIALKKSMIQTTPEHKASVSEQDEHERQTETESHSNV